VLRIGVIGYGYWGPNLVRNFSESSEMQVVAVSDLDEARLRNARLRYPAIEVTTSHKTLFANRDIDAIAIATPVSSHFDLAMQALQAGKHVFVEKPLTESSVQAQQLIEEADKRGLILHVDHTFIYTGAVRKMHELVTKRELGELLYYDSVRVNLGLFQRDVNVIWDLAVHDLSILDFVFPFRVTAVSACGLSHVPGKPANIAYLTLFMENNCIGHIHVNWLAPVKVRRTLVGGSRKMIVYDDLEPSEKIKVYDKGLVLSNERTDEREEIYHTQVGYRTGDMWAPQLDGAEALRLEAEHFYRCISHGEMSISDGRVGLRVVRILEAASQSMQERGRPVELKHD
jgi:predicted dehydrogenase